MKKRAFVALTLCICILVGCGSTKEKEQVQSSVQTENIAYTGMASETEEFSYEVIPMKPRVLTDQIGYEPNCAKTVLFRGNGLADSFHVVNAQNEDVVFTGEIEYIGLDERTGEKIGIGVFTGLVENGTYYIVTPVIGESYSFEIAEGLYEEVFRASCLAFEKLWDTEATYQPENLQKDAGTIGNLLIAFEYYTGIFQDDLGAVNSGNGIPDILDILQARVDEILTLPLEELTYEELACYTGVLAQFYQDEKNFYAEHAAQCLLKAQEGYLLLEKMDRTGQDEGYYFYAAAQMYRATGYATYHTAVKNYLTTKQDTTGPMDFYGKLAYMSCKYAVDIALCDDIISTLMEQVEEISKESSENPYLVCSYENQKICEQMAKLAVVNYVITNHEYVTVQENHLHYLLGRNADGISYISGAGHRRSENAGDSITTDSYQNSALILMMCEIMRKEHAE